MSDTNRFSLASMWSRAGAMFCAHPASDSPDLERLLLDSARNAPENSRLFIMAASWLSKHGNRINGHRLAGLIASELEPQFSPVMGLLLDEAGKFSGTCRFKEAIAKCKPAERAAPLFKVEAQNPTLCKLAERRASTLSRKWNLWAAEFEPKYDAIRPESWILAANPSYEWA